MWGPGVACENGDVKKEATGSESGYRAESRPLQQQQLQQQHYCVKHHNPQLHNECKIKQQQKPKELRVKIHLFILFVQHKLLPPRIPDPPLICLSLRLCSSSSRMLHHPIFWIGSQLRAELHVLDHFGLIWTICIWRFRGFRRGASNTVFIFIYVMGSFYGIHANKSVSISGKKAAVEGKSEKCCNDCAHWSVKHLELLTRPCLGFPVIRTLLISPSRSAAHAQKESGAAEPPWKRLLLSSARLDSQLAFALCVFLGERPSHVGTSSITASHLNLIWKRSQQGPWASLRLRAGPADTDNQSPVRCCCSHTPGHFGARRKRCDDTQVVKN